MSGNAGGVTGVAVVSICQLIDIFDRYFFKRPRIPGVRAVSAIFVFWIRAIDMR